MTREEIEGKIGVDILELIKDVPACNLVLSENTEYQPFERA